jgi:hypothetical protein
MPHKPLVTLDNNPDLYNPTPTNNFYKTCHSLRTFWKSPRASHVIKELSAVVPSHHTHCYIFSASALLAGVLHRTTLLLPKGLALSPKAVTLSCYTVSIVPQMLYYLEKKKKKQKKDPHTHSAKPWCLDPEAALPGTRL